MKLGLSFIVLVCALAGSASVLAAPPAKTPSSAPTHCIPLSKIDRTMDPVYLTSSLVACVRAGQMDAAVDLFNVGGVFARFDTLRVPDKTAHAAYPALAVVAGQAMTEQQRTAFEEHLKARSNAPGYHDVLCQFTAQLSPPSYNPVYMTRHGMGSFLGTPQTAKPFQPATAWSQVRTEYLGCPI